jgi:hypothetical protein
MMRSGSLTVNAGDGTGILPRKLAFLISPSVRGPSLTVFNFSP